MDGKICTFLKPYLDYIDAGKLYKQPFRILYLLIAAAMLLFPFYILYTMIDGDVFGWLSGGQTVVAILLWLILAAAGWLSAQLWWLRCNAVLNTSTDGDDFVATPVISHFVQTSGEWFGSYFAVVGFLVTLLSLATPEVSSVMFPFGGPIGNWTGLLVFPVAGFLIIVTARWMAEMMRAVVAIANNTKK